MTFREPNRLMEFEQTRLLETNRLFSRHLWWCIPESNSATQLILLEERVDLGSHRYFLFRLEA